MTDYLHDIALNWPAAAARLLLLTLCLFAFWRVLNALTKFDDEHELIGKNNWAFQVQRLSLVAALIIGSLPALTRDRGDHSLNGYVYQGLETLWVIVALLIARVVVDYVVLAKVNNTDAISGGNLAVGITEAGFYVGFGFILNGSLTGNSPSVALGLASTVVFGVLGLLVVIAVYGLHELVTPWNLRENIRDNKVTAAIEVAGILAALGVVVRTGVAGDFTNWQDGFIAFFATVLFAVATLYLFRWFIDRALLTTTTVRAIQAQNQTAAAAFMSGTLFAASLAVAAIVSTQL